MSSTPQQPLHGTKETDEPQAQQARNTDGQDKLQREREKQEREDERLSMGTSTSAIITSIKKLDQNINSFVARTTASGQNTAQSYDLQKELVSLKVDLAIIKRDQVSLKESVDNYVSQHKAQGLVSVAEKLIPGIDQMIAMMDRTLNAHGKILSSHKDAQPSSTEPSTSEHGPSRELEDGEKVSEA